MRPEDRIGSSLQEEGFVRLDTFAEDRNFILDVELWDFAPQPERDAHALRLANAIAERGGEVTDQYIGVTFTALRVNAPGTVIRHLLEEPVVRFVDFPPQVDLDVAQLLETTIDTLGVVEPPDEDAPIVAVLIPE